MCLADPPYLGMALVPNVLDTALLEWISEYAVELIPPQTVRYIPLRLRSDPLSYLYSYTVVCFAKHDCSGKL